MADDPRTIAQACAEFERAGQPIAERNLRGIIRNLPGFRPVGRPPSGPKGGRGHPLYDRDELEQLHGFLASRGWLTPPPGDT